MTAAVEPGSATVDADNVVGPAIDAAGVSGDAVED